MPQSPTAATSMITSSGPGTGSSIVVTSIVPGAVITTALTRTSLRLGHKTETPTPVSLSSRANSALMSCNQSRGGRHVRRGLFGSVHQRPRLPSIVSRMMSAWPACLHLRPLVRKAAPSHDDLEPSPLPDRRALDQAQERQRAHGRGHPRLFLIGKALELVDQSLALHVEELVGLLVPSQETPLCSTCRGPEFPPTLTFRRTAPSSRVRRPEGPSQL